MKDFVSVALAKEAKKRFRDGTHMLAVFEQVTGETRQFQGNLEYGVCYVMVDRGAPIPSMRV